MNMIDGKASLDMNGVIFYRYHHPILEQMLKLEGGKKVNMGHYEIE